MLFFFACLLAFCGRSSYYCLLAAARAVAVAVVRSSGAVADVINTHHYTNTSDETCLVVLQAGMVCVCWEDTAFL
jgi:hypothetical protein